MTNRDQLRAAFEAWARRGVWSLKMWPSGLAEYLSTATESAWQGFLAGHAAALAGAQPQQPAAVRATPEEIAATELTPEEFAPMQARLLKSLAEQRAQVAGASPALSDERIVSLANQHYPAEFNEVNIIQFTRAVLAAAAAAAPDHSPGVGKMVDPGVHGEQWHCDEQAYGGGENRKCASQCLECADRDAHGVETGAPEQEKP